MMTGTCGHEVTIEDTAEGLSIKSYDREGDACVSFVCVCAKCRQEYEREGLVLHNEAEELAWFNNG